MAVHEALADVVGREHCLREASALARYAVDGVIPAMVVRPATADEVSRVVALCAAERLAIADDVIDANGSLDQTLAQVDALWHSLHVVGGRA